jgi:predicted phage terminase large subunit-like protein
MNNRLRLDLALLDRSLAADSLAEFYKQAWPMVEPATDLRWNWHLDVVCEYLEALAADGGLSRVIINMPPRFGKSILVSVIWPAWVWAKQPWTRWLFASYAASLANKFSIDRRSILASPWYQERWPVQFAGDQNQKSEFMNTARGHMIATSVGGSITGKGGDFIVVDDLQNPEMAESAAARETVNRFFDETLASRLDDKRRGRIVVIQQRTHQADLTGHLLERGGWIQLSLPALFERRMTISLPVTRREVVKVAGDLLWPEREGVAELEAAKFRLGSYAYNCQYLQNPIARGGNLFKQDWFGRFRERPKFDVLIQSWDCAFKTGQTNDFSACLTIGWVRSNPHAAGAAPGCYLVHAWRGRLEFPDLKRKALELYQQWNPSKVLIEDTASGQSLLQELRTAIPIEGVKPEGDKMARAASVTPMVEGGQFWLLEGAPWLEEYLEEMVGFPGAANDDQVDATVQALSHLRQPQEPHIITYFREAVSKGRTFESTNAFLTSKYELECRRLRAEECYQCHDSLFMKSAVTDGPGYLCIDCYQEKQRF